jgi:hypothetical protein
MTALKEWTIEDVITAADLNNNFSVLGLARKLVLSAAENLNAGDALATYYFQADGGVKYDTNAYADYNNPTLSGTSMTVPITIANNPNRILVVAVTSGYGGGAPTVAANGVNMTWVATASYSSYRTHTYYIVAPTVGAINVIATGCQSGNAYRMFVYSYYNASQTSQPANHAEATAANTTFNTTVDGCLVWTVSGAGTTVLNSPYYCLDNHQISLWSNYNLGMQAAGDGGVITPAAVTTVGVASGPQLVAALAIAPYSAVTYRAAAKATAVTNNMKCRGFIGFAHDTVSIGADILVDIGGIVSGYTGLTIGSTYYLQDTPGAIGKNSGSVARIVGKAISETELLITNIW